MDYLIKNQKLGITEIYHNLANLKRGLDIICQFSHWDKEAQEAYMFDIRSGKKMIIRQPSGWYFVGKKSAFKG